MMLRKPRKDVTMKRLVPILAGLAACAAPASALAAPTPVGLPSGSTTLDSYSHGHTAPTAKTSFKLPRGVWYIATVSGTLSYWTSINYSHPQSPYRIVCGTPEEKAQYPGSRGGDGPVGLDAAFVFSRPWNRSNCKHAHLPIRWHNFDVSQGGVWVDPTTLGPAPTTPTANHTYRYVVLGENQPAQFRLTDIYYRDNYGELHISMAPATSAACGDYTSFGFASEAECTSSLPAGS
jgi:hypothetical protein